MTDTASQNGSIGAMASDTNASMIVEPDQSTDTLPEVSPVEHPITKIPHILPHQRVFPIQIGGEKFNLSGASLSSDAPSYFSQYFLCQIKDAEQQGLDLCAGIKTLYIDRDPHTFRDIALHLQGYHIKPRDGTHYVRLFADAQFYSLPGLISQLYNESVFISIGDREFSIPRGLVSDPVNSPNFFSIGFAAYFSSKDDVFPGLDRSQLIRPPSISPPSVPSRSADTFAQLLHLLRGYPVSIRDEAHRAELIRDAHYYHFKALEQRLLPHSLSFNLARQRSEIVLRLENVQRSGISVAAGDHPDARWVNYARPWVDDKPAELILEIGCEDTKLHFPAGDDHPPPRAEFFRDTRARVVRLAEVVASKLDPPASSSPGDLTPLGEGLVRVSLTSDAAIVLDGRDHQHHAAAPPPTASDAPPPGKRARTEGGRDDDVEWVVRTGQWRVKVESRPGGSVEVVFVAVKIDAVSSELGRNRSRGFLV